MRPSCPHASCLTPTPHQPSLYSGRSFPQGSASTKPGIPVPSESDCGCGWRAEVSRSYRAFNIEANNATRHSPVWSPVAASPVIISTTSPILRVASVATHSQRNLQSSQSQTRSLRLSDFGGIGGTFEIDLKRVALGSLLATHKVHCSSTMWALRISSKARRIKSKLR